MKSYLITDPKYYTNDVEQFKITLQKKFDNFDINMVCFRDKISANYEELAKVFIQTSKSNNIKDIFLNGNISLAYNLKATGVHLTSTQFDDIKKAQKLKLKVIISCHTIDDIQKAQKKKVDFITYSPIFDTPNKGKPKGIEVLKNIAFKYDINIIALGGIVTKEHIIQIENTNCYGFASIRYFIKENIDVK